MSHETREVTLRLSEGTKALAREIFLSTIEPKVHIPDIGFISAKLGLILDLLEGDTQQKVDEVAAKIRTVREQLEAAVNNQPKEK